MNTFWFWGVAAADGQLWMDSHFPQMQRLLLFEELCFAKQSRKSSTDAGVHQSLLRLV